MTAVIHVPVVCQRAAGNGGAADVPPSRGVGGNTLNRLGRDLQVGDQVQRGPEVFLIVGFEARRTNARGAVGRLAVNTWGEGFFVQDDSQQTVLNPSCSALLNHR